MRNLNPYNNHASEIVIQPNTLVLLAIVKAIQQGEIIRSLVRFSEYKSTQSCLGFKSF